MREALFIKKNAQKWQEYEHFETNDPDEMASRFTTLVDDLAYAKTFYPHSKVTRLINGLAVAIYQSIYQNKKEKYSRLISFWKTELPMIIRKNHKTFLFTLIVFAVCCVMGIISSMRDYEFVKGVLGENYVAMTEENISNGDPFGVYKTTSEGGYFSSFIELFYHNVQIDFLMFICGLFFGVITLHLLFSNSVMLGCFQYMFFAKGLGIKSVLVIWVHGTLEISAMIISSTAGFIIAKSILFPGSYSRLSSFKTGIKDAVKIMIIFVPMTLGAAFLESYITHLMSETFDKDGKGGMPVWASLLILGGSLCFVVWYFIIYPILVERKLKRLNPSVSKSLII
ncbi:MAG TPA: stage II sporulation protein M [Chitinophagaceae bacterium]|jgi:uncharacterized membrane protein SpoIIM required for sporulation|nr:stage II sporulation protein M [Chitinophagaceae bacterium]